MVTFVSIVKRIYTIIPKGYERIVLYFVLLSLIVLLLDIFSIFLLIPLIVSLIDNKNTFIFFPTITTTINSFLLIGIIMLFFLIKNFVTIKINKFQAKTVYRLGAEYALLLSKYYILGNYIDFKKQKKSTITKDIIFVSNDFVSNILLSINSIISETILLLFICSIGLLYNYKITFLIITLLTIVLFIFKNYNKKDLEKINKTRVEDFDTNISNLNNLLNSYLSIKSSNVFTHFLAVFNRSNKKLNNSYAVLQAKRVNSSKQTEILLVSLLCITFISIHIFKIQEEENIIIFLSVFASLLFKSIPSVNRLNIAFTNFRSHLYTLDIIEEKTTIIEKVTHNTKPIIFDQQITLNNISFSYEKEQTLLKKITFRINKGQFMGISGISGIGKTTLLNIIAKLINPSEGIIQVDNQIITEENKYSYFNLFTYITQKPFIYEGSIKDNLMLGNKRYNDFDTETILKALLLDKVIDQFPDKLNTYIGSDASNLSAGQLQRICIARAVLNKTEILILDEATNNLDEEMEIIVLNFLKSFSKKHNITIISVSHHMEKTKYIYDQIIGLKENE